MPVDSPLDLLFAAAQSEENKDAVTSDIQANKSKPAWVVFDMDNTLIRTRKHMEWVTKIYQCENGSDDWPPMPEDFIIEGALELIRDLINSGVKVSVISHACGHTCSELIANKLKDMGVEVNSIVTILDIHNELSPDQDLLSLNSAEIQARQKDLIKKYGKDRSTYMAECALDAAKVSEEEFENMSVFVIGDSISDLAFAYNIKDQLVCKEVIAIHISEKTRQSNVQRVINDLVRHGVPAYATNKFSEIREILREKLGLDLSNNIAAENVVGAETKDLPVAAPAASSKRRVEDVVAKKSEEDLRPELRPSHVKHVRPNPRGTNVQEAMSMRKNTEKQIAI